MHTFWGAREEPTVSGAQIEIYRRKSLRQWPAARTEESYREEGVDGAERQDDDSEQQVAARQGQDEVVGRVPQRAPGQHGDAHQQVAQDGQQIQNGQNNPEDDCNGNVVVGCGLHVLSEQSCLIR